MEDSRYQMDSRPDCGGRSLSLLSDAMLRVIFKKLPLGEFWRSIKGHLFILNSLPKSFHTLESSGSEAA